MLHNVLPISSKIIINKSSVKWLPDSIRSKVSRLDHGCWRSKKYELHVSVEKRIDHQIEFKYTGN